MRGPRVRRSIERAILRVGIAAALVTGLGSPVAAQDPNRTVRKFDIIDNSFLVEESFNQEAGVFQNIFTWIQEPGGNWQAGFTQEWPLRGMAHQFSYTIPFARLDAAGGVNDMLLNYRYQLLTESDRRPAVSPRISVVMPTGRPESGLGDGAVGLQFNVPVSKQFGDVYLHGNAGGTWLHGVDWTPLLAGSGLWRAADMFHVMLEAVALLGDSTTISPGFRWGWNIGKRQIVVGAALPVTRADDRSTVAVLGYFSYELPFR